jgi:cell division protein FtsA
VSLFRSSSDIAHLGKLSTSRATTLSVIDVGSSKICCMVARLTPRDESSVLPGRSHNVEVLGFGHQRSQGIKSGVVVDMDLAERALRLAVDGAERSAGVTVDSLIVSASAGRIGSDTFSSSVVLGGREAEASDVKAVLAAGYEHALEDQRIPLHALPIGYSLDKEHGIRDPLAMAGEELGVDMHVVSADYAPLRNLEACINRSHLSVDAMVAAPYASGLAALVDDEARMGCACIDMGAGTTTVSIFLGGNLVFADAISVGGGHVTMDIARVLSTPVSEAERMKVLYGSASPSRFNDEELLTVSPVGGDPNALGSQISVGQLSQIISPRVEETFEFVRDRINRSGFAGAVGKRMVLTGGASQLGGVSEIAARVLGSPVRLGRPMGVAGLPKTAKGPAFSAAAGLLIYPQISHTEYVGGASSTLTLFSSAGGGTFSRMGRWLKESF